MITYHAPSGYRAGEPSPGALLLVRAQISAGALLTHWLPWLLLLLP